MHHTRLPSVTVLIAALLIGGCARTPEVAVIAMSGVPRDARYLSAVADSFLQGPHPVRVKIFSSGEASDAYRRALERAQSIVKTPGLVAVVGHHDSRSTLVVGPVYRDAGIPLVVPNATSRAIADLGPMVFRMVADNDEEGAFLARVAVTRLRARRVSVFYLSDEYGIGIRNATLKDLADAGVTPISATEYGTARVKCPGDFQALVDASLLKGPPDVVILASRMPDAACIVRLVGSRVPGARFVTADGVDPGARLRTAAGPAVKRLWLTQFWTPLEDSASAAFAREYKRRSGAPPDQGTALRWDGVRLLVAAIRQVGPHPGRIADYLRELGHSRPPFHGITGDIYFGPHPHTLLLVDAWGRPVPPRGG